MIWKFNGTRPVFLQIADRLRLDIVNGVYPPDSQFPTVRQLASEAAVNPNTMQRAMLMLENEGILYAKGTVGRFVTSDVEVLSTAKEKMIKEKVRNLLDETEALGISKQKLIDYINEEKDISKEEDI